MEEYRVYVIGQDVISRIELQCSDEGEANGSQEALLMATLLSSGKLIASWNA